MKVVVLYRPNSEYARTAEEFAREFEGRTWNKKVQLLSLDTREGAALATLYDVVRHPAILAMRDDGQLQQMWQGDPLPLFNEVAAYS